MTFRTGPEINPFFGASQEPIVLLESITPAELANCVPIIKIVKIDKRTGKPSEDSRPLMFDLIQTPQFASVGDDFGTDRDTFAERSLVSLQSLKVSTTLSYGFLSFKEVTLQFVVHHPALIFDRFSKIPWRELLEEGNSFSLEYGWSADPTVVSNPLFNGIGHVNANGSVVKSSQTVLLVVSRYQLHVKQTGEVEVTVHALENGDIALRESRFSDAYDAAAAKGLFGTAAQDAVVGTEPRTESDVNTAAKLRSMISSLVPIVNKGRDNMYRMGDILDTLIAPLIESAARGFGYSGETGPVEMILGNFNRTAGVQSAAYGGRHMGGVTSIGDFLVPAKTLNKVLSFQLSTGRSFRLANAINFVIETINGTEAWATSTATPTPIKPNVFLKADTIKNADGSLKLIITILDAMSYRDILSDDQRLALDSQSKEQVMAVLNSRGVPVLEFARAGSLILDSNFEIQPDPLLQAIQIDAAYRDRKDRVEQTQMPDTESRVGRAAPHEIVPASILEGDVSMLGNFVIESFSLLWVEFFGASTISGVFHAFEKDDEITPGFFKSTVKLRSDGLDPLNTRRRKTDQEFADERALADKIRKKKK